MLRLNAFKEVLKSARDQSAFCDFFSVLLWNPIPQSYGANDYGRNLLYVAVTRAEENLCIVTWGRPASALPPFGISKLIRSMDMTITDEDEVANRD